MLKAASKKEADALDHQGSVVARVYTSDAKIPVQGATVIFTKIAEDGQRELLAVRLTNYDGYTDPIFVDAPPLADSRNYSPDANAYNIINITAEESNYGRILVRNAQVFPDTETVQEFMLIPSPMLPEQFGQTEVFVIPPQNL